MEGSNLRFLSQSQASYHWTNPQRRGTLARCQLQPGEGLARRRALRVLSILLIAKLTVK